MNRAVLEPPKTYEEERGKPMPSKNHALWKDPCIELTAELDAVFS